MMPSLSMGRRQKISLLVSRQGSSRKMIKNKTKHSDVSSKTANSLDQNNFFDTLSILLVGSNRTAILVIEPIICRKYAKNIFCNHPIFQALLQRNLKDFNFNSDSSSSIQNKSHNNLATLHCNSFWARGDVNFLSQNHILLLR